MFHLVIEEAALPYICYLPNTMCKLIVAEEAAMLYISNVPSKVKMLPSMQLKLPGS